MNQISGYRLPLSLLLVLPVFGGVAGTTGWAAEEQDTVKPAIIAKDGQPDPTRVTTVELIVDYGDGFQKRFLTIPWREKMTVEDALKFAGKHRRGIQFEARGKGSTALLLKIDDLKNQGLKGLNWVFRVNNKLGDRSYAVSPIRAGDTILWKFDKYK